MIQTSAIHNDRDRLSMRGVFSSLFRWITVAVFGSKRFYFRPEQAEFPVTHQSVCNLFDRPFRGSSVAGRASIDALRLINNSVNIKDTYPNEISFIRETSATFAWRLSPKGRPPTASSGDASASSEEDILAKTRGIFLQRQNREEASQCQCQCQCQSQRRAASTAAAAAA